MTSSGPYSQSNNFTHMFDFTDYKGPLPTMVPCPNTLLGLIYNNPDFSIFKFMVHRSKLNSFFNLSQADFTVFIPSDKELLKRMDESIFTNMDILTARSIVKSCMLNNRISSEVLEDSPAAYYYTTEPSNRLFITNLNGNTIINNNIKIIKKDILLKNGIVHVIDGLVIPIII